MAETLSVPSPAGRAGALLAGALLLLAATGREACADEILHHDPETGAIVTTRAEEIVSETWTEVTYRDRQRGPTKSLPTPLVKDVVRSAESAQARDLVNAIAELSRGGATEAATALGNLSGGGWRQDVTTRERTYRPFTEAGTNGGGSRPDWTSEYAHFYYVKALYQDGVARGDKERLEEAWLALEDQPVPGGSARTGGFLARFKGGNSRFYAEAMILKGDLLLALGRHDDAAKAYEEVYDKVIGVDLGPRWAFQAALGPGRVAEAKGDALDAVNKYKDAANFMRLRLEAETRGFLRRAIGVYHSRARMRAAAVMLEQAEKNKSPAEFQRLREFLEQGSAAALRAGHRALPPAQVEALVAGALDPEVQAVSQNGMGLAYLSEKDYERAILAFRSVDVKYFAVAAEHARALHYLAKAADAAAKAASGAAARAFHERTRDEALERLKAEHPQSRWSAP
jgi:tetratricopeptide (TPR) repeat protein